MSIEKARKIVAAIEDANDRAHGAATAWCPDEAVELIAAALSAAHAEPVARDPSRFSRLSPDEPPVIRERPDPTLGFISTAEMLASPSEASRDERAVYRHKKRGTTYEVIGKAEVQTSQPLTDYEVVVVYRSLDGNIDVDGGPMKGDLWVRPLAEFEDGRFERIATAIRARGER